MAGAHTEDIQKHIRTYLVVFAALAGLTVITVTASWMNVSHGMHIGVAMLIAVVKATLVACFFMHLISERKALYWILALCVFFFLHLLILPTATSTETEGLAQQVTHVP